MSDNEEFEGLGDLSDETPEDGNFVDDLEETDGSSPPPAAAQDSKKKSNKIFIGALGALLVVAGVGGYSIMHKGSEPSQQLPQTGEIQPLPAEVQALPAEPLVPVDTTQQGTGSAIAAMNADASMVPTSVTDVTTSAVVAPISPESQALTGSAPVSTQVAPGSAPAPTPAGSATVAPGSATAIPTPVAPGSAPAQTVSAPSTNASPSVDTVTILDKLAGVEKDITSMLGIHGQKIDTLSTRVDKIESRLDSLPNQAVSGEATVQKTVKKYKKKSNKNKTLKAKNLKKSATAVPMELVTDQQSTGSHMLNTSDRLDSCMKGYTIQAMIAGRVWLRDHMGVSTNYAVGDRLPDGNVLTEINVEKGTLSTKDREWMCK